METWARLSGDPEQDDETSRAQSHATRATLTALPELAERIGADEETVRRLREEYEGHLDAVQDGPDGESAAARETERQLRLAALEHKRRGDHPIARLPADRRGGAA